jgi:glutamyl-tRNA reductase
VRVVAEGSAPLLLVGASHRTAAIERRERVGRLGDPGAWLTAARASVPAVAELLVLATCHRVELYAVASGAGVRAAQAGLEALLAPVSSGDPEAVYVRHGEAAIEHLCRVACGLDSLIVGEAEIAGQVRRAGVASREAGTLGPLLERALAGALRASGRARSETGIARGVMSAASAAVALATGMLGRLDDRVVLVAGAGQMGRQALMRLSRLAPRRLLVASRSARHADEAAASSGATAVALDAVGSLLPDVDLLIAALHASAPIIDRAAMTRRDRALLAIDLSVPRVIDPDLASVPGVTLRAVDDLGAIAARSAAQRAREIPRVEAIARDEARRAMARLSARVARAFAR